METTSGPEVETAAAPASRSAKSGDQRAPLEAAAWQFALVQAGIAAAGSVMTAGLLLVPGLAPAIQMGGGIVVLAFTLVALVVSAHRGVHGVGAFHRAEIAALEQEISDLTFRLSVNAVVDPPTGVYTRAYLTSRLKQELERARRYQRPVSLALVDIAGFRTINMTHGRAVADDVLRRFALNVLRASVRGTDLVGRNAGDQFLVLLLEADQRQALVALRRIEARAGRGVPLADSGVVPLTVTFGLAAFPENAQTDEELLHKAEAALLAAKAAQVD